MTQVSSYQQDALARCAVVFEAGDPPRTGSMAFWNPDSAGLPDGVGKPGELDVVVPREGSVAVMTVPVVRLPVGDAVGVLSRVRRSRTAHPAAAFWGTATVAALRLVAQGRLLPGVSPGDFDAWRVGPLGQDDLDRIHLLAEAMPAEARAVAVPGTSPWELPDPRALVRGFLDAVADALPRGAEGTRTTASRVFGAVEPLRVPGLRDWSDEVAAGVDAGVRISLRLEAHDLERSSLRAVVQVHSVADPTRITEAGQLWRGQGNGFGERSKVDTVRAVRRAARVWAPLDGLLRLPVPDELVLVGDEIQELLGEAAARLAEAGIDVHWPRELGRGLTAKVVVGGTDAPPSDLASVFGGDKVFGFDWRIALGGAPLTVSEMDQLAEANRPIVRLRDQWVLVDPNMARKAKERTRKPLTAIDALGAALSGTTEVDGERVEVAPSGWLAALRERISDPDGGREPLPQPEGLTATLRDYQLRGLRWLARMTELGLGGCLADDMGLGKTITLIALHLCRQTTASTAGPTLVVCPASLLGNWEREIERFAPGTPVRRFHGTTRSLDEAREGFVLTTYGTMRLDVDRLGAHTWGLLVADEAQHVKNPMSGTAKALRRIPAGARVALSGTPVENNLSELWAILDWTTPGLLGSLGTFRTRWAKPIEAGGGDTDTAESFARLIRPFLLRRRKSDPGIAPELPSKTETDRPVALTMEQAGLYEAAVRETMARIETSDGMARRGLVFKLLTALKQICNHPAQYLGESRPKLAGRSGKLELLDELLDTILAEDGAVLVFTQYVGMATLIEQHLAVRGIDTQLLHGGTPVPRRDEMVRRFQNGEVPVFLLSLKAAGTGLNLTRADHVVHYDRWWNPAVEEQATDRAYRIGQTKPVQVHRMIAEGTVEDTIAAMLASKRELADAVLRSGEGALTELSTDDLANLVELRSVR